MGVCNGITIRGLGGIDLTQILPPNCDQVGLDSFNIDGLISSRLPNSVTIQLPGGQPPQTGHVVQSEISLRVPARSSTKL